jgi:hypothetical protein
MTIFDEVAGGPSSSPAELSVLSLCTGHAEDTTATETTPDGMERPGLAIHIYFGDPHDVVPVEYWGRSVFQNHQQCQQP